MTTRTDLAFLRRRGRPAAPEPEPAATPPQQSGDASAAVADFLAGRSRRPGREQPAAPASNPLDLDTPAASSGSSGGGLDLSDPTPSSATASGSDTAVSDFLRGRSRRPSRAAQQPPEQPAASGGNPLDLDSPSAPAAPSTPSGGNPLDLDSPQTPAAPATSTGVNRLDLGSTQEESPTPPASSGGNPLSLDEPAAPAASGDSLDLGAPGAAGPEARTSPSGRHRRLVRHELALPTIAAGERLRMDPDEAVVHLTRAQSAFGSLEVTTAVPDGAQMHLGVAYESRGDEGVVLSGVAAMGPDPRSPIFRISGAGLVVNLRHVTRLDRFLIYAVLTGQDKQMPGGTVVVATYGGARLELPLSTQATYGAQALITAYVVEGRIVLRAEHDPFSGTLHQVCDAYGYSELTWKDPFTPLV